LFRIHNFRIKSIMPVKRRSAKSDESPVSTKRAKLGDAATTAPFPAGPGGPMEIVFSFDTTGSCASQDELVRHDKPITIGYTWPPDGRVRSWRLLRYA
jgi:hypothetical protein